LDIYEQPMIFSVEISVAWSLEKIIEEGSTGHPFG
jgi:hypothetical protein